MYRDMLDPLNHSDEHLMRYYRFPRQEILDMCRELDGHLARPTRRSHGIPTHTQVLVTLRFLASGTFQSVIGDMAGVTQSSVSRVVNSVVNVLSQKAMRDIKMPTDILEIARTARGFFRVSGFPREIGAIDGNHTSIKAAHINPPIYVNKKGYHSINVQAVCNSENLITHFSVRYTGSSHDFFIWNHCSLRDKFARGDFQECHLLGKIEVLSYV